MILKGRLDGATAESYEDSFGDQGRCRTPSDLEDHPTAIDPQGHQSPRNQGDQDISHDVTDGAVRPDKG